jgi:hypothetical protein
MPPVIRRMAVRGAALAVVLGASAACSLLTDLTGFSTPEPAESGTLASADAANDATPVVDSAPPPCTAQATFDTPLITGLDSWTGKAFNLAGYPRVESFQGTTAAVLFPYVDETPVEIDAGDPEAGPTFVTPPGHIQAHSGIWQVTPVPLRSFDVQYDFYLRCSSSSSCADGSSFAWLDTTDVSSLTNESVGHVMGLPITVSGAAVIADLYKNGADESSDPAVPAIEIVKIDKTLDVGHYPWVEAASATDFRAAWHTMAISVRGDTVEVRYDGAPRLSAKVPEIARGLVGISAGTGGKTSAAAVRNFKASFYDCEP